MLISLLLLSLTTLHIAADVDTLEPIAIVELFTSQGCSSCPAADKLLGQVVNDQKLQGDVYALSFHVSYWNRLGWTDPYSSEAYTNRQRLYAQKLRLNTLYTPQMIVDGRNEFVGSQKQKLLAALDNSFSEYKKFPIQISGLERTNNKLSFDYNITTVDADTWLQVAIVQRQVSNYVPRGENRSLTLRHANVVRAFDSISAKNSGYHSITFPKDVKSSDCDLVVFLQNQSTMEIKASGKISID